MKKSLAEVLQLPPQKRWHFLEQISTTRDLTSLKSINVQENDDNTSLSSMVKLLGLEARKSNHSHFEWDFFGANHYSSYMVVILQILSLPRDCERNLFPEVATTLMSMASTNIAQVCDTLKRNPKIEGALKKLLHNLPEAKSFHFEALLLEIVYRIFRMTKKSGDVGFGLRFLEALPLDLPSQLKLVLPKQFKDSTRKLLNSFNSQVGIVKSFELKNVVCRNLNKKIYEWKAQWVDIGGAAIESEVVYHDEGESFPGIIKIPFDAIKSIKALTTTKAVSITFCDGTSLGDILDGGRDMNWVKVFDCTIEFCFDSMTFAPALEAIEARLQKGTRTGSTLVKCDPMQECLMQTPGKRASCDYTENDPAESFTGSELKSFRACSSENHTMEIMALDNKSSSRERKIECCGDLAPTKKKKKKACNVTSSKSVKTDRISSGARSHYEGHGKIQNHCQQPQTAQRENSNTASKAIVTETTCKKVTSNDKDKIIRNQHNFRAKRSDVESKRVKNTCQIIEKEAERNIGGKKEAKSKFDNVQQVHADAIEICKISTEVRFILDRFHQVVMTPLDIGEGIQKDYDIVQRNLYKQMGNIIDKINFLVKYEPKLDSLAEALELLDSFSAISHEQQCKYNERKETEQQILHRQSQIADAIDSLSSIHHDNKTEVEEIHASFAQTKDQFRHHMRKIMKKIKAQSDSHLKEASSRMKSIEDSFSSDDLMAMQQMLSKL
ncbi:hypothetical protein ABG067_000426 [Albugo candida]